MSELDHKYEVDIILSDEKQKISKDIRANLIESGLMDSKGKLKIKGVSPKMLKRMKHEYVVCPVLNENVQFVKCYVCSNFQSRVTGQVLCKGDPL